MVILMISVGTEAVVRKARLVLDHPVGSESINITMQEY